MFIQSGLIVDADEDDDTILGYLDSGLVVMYCKCFIDRSATVQV